MLTLVDQLGAGPWILPTVFALVLLVALLVVVPGELAVSAAGALSTATGSPPLPALIAVAAVAAATGDLLCYLVGRAVRPARLPAAARSIVEGPRVQRALAWAATRLDRSMAGVVFTARFIPFARLAVNLTAGATRIPLRRYLSAVIPAALAWALYQSVIGAALGVVFQGAPLLAVGVAVAVAMGLGIAIDLLVARRRR